MREPPQKPFFGPETPKLDPPERPKIKPWRSVAKAVSWRAIGTLDTLILSYLLITYLGPMFGAPVAQNDALETASYIAITEVATKLAGSLLLGAILSPTDPVLAADVQVGAPLEGGEHPVRFALTTEAGLNDGLAFPFVYLGIAIATAGGISFGLLANWLALDVAYRIAVGVAAGLGLGWMLGKFLSAWPRDNALSETQSGVLGFAGVLAIYGAAELAEGYGFIAVFAAALVLRRKEADHHFHQKLHDFTEALEHALTSILLVALGSVLPVLWTYLDWQHAAIGAALIFLVRPAAGFLALQRSALDQRARIASAFYGVRGIGSLYYLAYAGNHIELVDEGSLWATVAFTIFLSTIAHGLTVGFALNFATRSGSERPRQSR